MGDTVERNKICSLKSHLCHRGCSICNLPYHKWSLWKIGKKRSVNTTRKVFSKMEKSSTEAAINELEKKTALDFDSKDNPLLCWKRFGFDIYERFAIDFFHLGILGLWRSYCELLFYKKCFL